MMNIHVFRIKRTTPSPALPLAEGKGARRAGRGVYRVKIVDSVKVFDFMITLILFIAVGSGMRSSSH
jgi:hypothetical protein